MVIVRATLTYEADSRCPVGSSMNFGRKLAPSLLGRVPAALLRLIQSLLAVKLRLLLSATLHQRKIQFPLQGLVWPLWACPLRHVRGEATI